MDPYTSAPGSIPPADRYADIPHYGRYLPSADDFHVDLEHVGTQSVASERYWESVLKLCDESVRIYPADEGGRDVFALGAIIVKSSHLHEPRDGQPTEIDYSYADANEVQATELARRVLGSAIRVPKIYFAGKIKNRQVLIQERIPGVCLNVALPYLSPEQRESFKRQARECLRLLHTVKPPLDRRKTRNYIVPDPNILTNGRIGLLEKEILFSNSSSDSDMAFMHNDFSPSNLIVDDDQIVGLIDWEMAGYFGWKAAGQVHRRIRTPQREHFINVDLSEDTVREIMWWNELYDESVL